MQETAHEGRPIHSYLLPQKSPAPPCQLPVGYLPLLFVIWTFICIGILLFILIPCRLKDPPIQANSTKPWVLRYTHRGLIKSFSLDHFVVFCHHIVNSRTTYDSTTLVSRWQFPQAHLSEHFDVRCHKVSK